MQCHRLAVDEERSLVVSCVEREELEAIYGLPWGKRVLLWLLAWIAAGDECPFKSGEIGDTGERQIGGGPRRLRREWRRRWRRVLQCEYVALRDGAVRIVAVSRLRRREGDQQH